jgi:hypothetical protein
VAHCAGNFIGDRDILGGQVDVEGDQWVTRADDNRPGFGQFLRAVIGVAFGFDADFGFDGFVLAFADGLQAGAVGFERGFFVQVDRDAQLLADTLAQVAGHGDALVHADAGNRDKRHDIGGAQARMFAAVLVEVDQFGGFFDGLEGGFLDGGWRPGVGDDGAVVVAVG